MLKVRAASLSALSLLSFLCSTAAGQAAPVRRVTAPLSPEHQHVVEAIPNEGTPRPSRHYFRSNEWRQDLLRPHLAGLGGAYLGVGSDQNYTMAAMAGSELLLLVDYDPLIPWVHEIYRVLVSESESPDALIARFSEESAEETQRLLHKALAEHPSREGIVRHYRERREPWFFYLRRVQRLTRDGQPFSWLASREMYDHVRALHRTRRIISRNGDLTTARTVRSMADAARRVGVPVRLVYFSNAEQFFTYSPEFIENMRALPTDDRSLVVRTIRHRDIPVAQEGRWHYLVHEFADFLERLETGAYKRSFAFASDLLAAGAPFLGADGVSTMTKQTRRAMLEEVRQRLAQRARD